MKKEGEGKKKKEEATTDRFTVSGERHLPTASIKEREREREREQEEVRGEGGDERRREGGGAERVERGQRGDDR